MLTLERWRTQHGISVALAGPSIFRFTAPTDPDRHRQVAAIFEELAEPHAKDNIDTARVPDADLGELLFDRIARFLVGLDVPRGLKAIGYGMGDVDELVHGTLPQRRVLDLARASFRCFRSRPRTRASGLTFLRLDSGL